MSKPHGSEKNNTTKMQEALIAPCGMNCRVCIEYIGYTMNGKKRKKLCPGCRPRDKQCAFLKKQCEKLSNKEIEYCFECAEFPCENLEKLDNRYREKYHTTMVENLEFIEGRGIDAFLEQQETTYTCPECGGILCVHDGKCYTCDETENKREETG